MSSRAKRRKTSPTSASLIDASNAHSSVQPSSEIVPAQITPKRASFQSPTKASLARFNPALLPPSRDTTEQSVGRVTRSGGAARESLVQQVLGRKRRSSLSLENASQDVRLAAQHASATDDAPDDDPQALKADSTRDSLSNAITRAFNESRPTASTRSPLRPRQPVADPLISQSDQNADRAQKRQPETHGADDFFETGPSSDDTGEPDLPPTPTELGISPHPDKPRGLSLSSSPSGRRDRRRTRDAAVGGVYKSSPLKPHDEPASGVAGGRADEAPESNAIEIEEILAEQRETDAHDEEDSELLNQKLETKRSLLSQLRRLQNELQQIESLVGTVETDDQTEALAIDDAMFNLLTTDNPSCLPPFAATNANLDSSPEIPDLISPGDAALEYLNLFSPGNLKLSTTSATLVNNSTDKKEGQAQDLIQRHTLTLAPPHPFPWQTFRPAFIVDTSITQERVLSVTLSTTSSRLNGHSNLRKWISDRLTSANSIHTLDVGTLVWGAGMYWTAAVERAKIFQTLLQTFNSPSGYTPDTAPNDDDIDDDNADDSPEEPKPLTKQDIKPLLPLLSKESITLTPTPNPAHAKNSSPSPAIHLSYTLHLDWTGDVTPRFNICLAPSSAVDTNASRRDGKHEGEGSSKIEHGVKDLFAMLRPKLGVKRAVAEVWELLNPESTS